MVNNLAVEVLLIEDNPDDAELTIRVLKKNNLANKPLPIFPWFHTYHQLIYAPSYQSYNDVIALATLYQNLPAFYTYPHI